LNDNEQRAIIQPQCLNMPDVRDLFQTVIEWINDELAEDRIIVSNIEQDLFDGQVLHKLWEKLTGNKLNVLEVTQSEEGQRQKLSVVLNAVNHVR
jgi:parvin